MMRIFRSFLLAVDLVITTPIRILIIIMGVIMTLYYSVQNHISFVELLNEGLIEGMRMTAQKNDEWIETGEFPKY